MPAAATLASFSYGVRADVLDEELERAARRLLEIDAPGVGVLMRHPRLQLDALHDAGVVDVELRDADRIQPRRDRHRLLPVRPPAPVAEVGLLDQQAVGHDLVLRAAP